LAVFEPKKPHKLAKILHSLEPQVSLYFFESYSFLSATRSCRRRCLRLKESPVLLHCSIPTVHFSNMVSCCSPSILSLLLLLLPFACKCSVHMYSHSTGWSLTPAPHSAPSVHHSPISTVAFLQFRRVHVVVRRADAAPDAESFSISAAACAGGGGDHINAQCFGPQSVYELAPGLSSAASDLDHLLLAVAGSASPYGCSHVIPLTLLPSPF
jgi:hypothetical protein